MSFLEDLAKWGIRGVGAIGGGIAGGIAGGPGGALAGGSAGLGLGNALDNMLFPSDDAASLYENLKYTDPNNDPAYKAAIGKLQEYAKGGLTSEDKARLMENLSGAGQFANGQRGAIENSMAERGGPNVGLSSVLQNQATQGAASRVSSATSQADAMQQQRAQMASAELSRQLAMNAQMQNQFALSKTGGQAQYTGAGAAAQNANLSATTNQLGNLGMTYYLNGQKKPGGDGQGGAPATAPPPGIQLPGNVPDLRPAAWNTYQPQDGWGGFKGTGLPMEYSWGEQSPQAGSAPSTETASRVQQPDNNIYNYPGNYGRPGGWGRGF